MVREVKRRAVIVFGATFLAVGVAGVLVLQDVLSADPDPRATVTALVLLALIPVGFVLLFEALVTWPGDGSPYPLRRRATSVATALAAGSVGLLLPVLVHQALTRAHAGDSWRATATGGALIAGMQVARAVWLRLHTGRWSSSPARQQPNGGKSAG